MDLLRLLDRLGQRRHRPGSSGLWTGVALAAFLLRRYRRKVGEDTLSLREELRPGQSLLITHLDQPRG